MMTMTTRRTTIRWRIERKGIEQRRSKEKQRQSDREQSDQERRLFLAVRAFFVMKEEKARRTESRQRLY